MSEAEEYGPGGMYADGPNTDPRNHVAEPLVPSTLVWQPTDHSSNVLAVASAWVDAGVTCDVYVEFKNGALYVYRQVPAEVGEHMGECVRLKGSVGAYVAQHLRGQYATERIR